MTQLPPMITMRTSASWDALTRTVDATGEIPPGMRAAIKLHEQRYQSLDAAVRTPAELTVDDVQGDDFPARLEQSAISSVVASLMKGKIHKLREQADLALMASVKLTEIHDCINTAWVEAHEALADAHPDFAEIPASAYADLNTKAKARYDRTLDAINKVAHLAVAQEAYLRALDSKTARQVLGFAETVFWSMYDPTEKQYKAAKDLVWRAINHPHSTAERAILFANAGLIASMAARPEDATNRRLKHLDEAEYARTAAALQGALTN